MKYKQRNFTRCARCNEESKMLNDLGLCADCMLKTQADLLAKDIAVNEVKTTVYIPTPGAIRISVVSSLITAAVLAATLYWMGRDL